MNIIFCVMDSYVLLVDDHGLIVDNDILTSEEVVVKCESHGSTLHTLRTDMENTGRCQEESGGVRSESGSGFFPTHTGNLYAFRTILKAASHHIPTGCHILHEQRYWTR